MSSYYMLRYRDQTGQYVDYQWHAHFLYMDYQRTLGGDVEKGQIIIPWGYDSCDPWYDSFWVGDPNEFDVHGPDTIIEIWRGSCESDGEMKRSLPMRLEGQFLVRNYRRELLNDGRMRTTIVVRGIKDFLKRPIIYPQYDPPGGPPTLNVTDDPVSITDAIANWGSRPTPLADQFSGYISGGVSGDTKRQMEATVNWCMTTNPRALSKINAIVPAAGGGITNHAIAYRYDNLLDALNEMSSASWYAWFYGAAPVTNGPVDWDLEYSASQPFYPYTFTTYVGGRGVDRRLNNLAGNPPLIISATSPGAIQPVILQDRTGEYTRIVVGGSGDKAARDILGVESDYQYHSAYNTIEKFVNSSKSGDASITTDQVIRQMVATAQAELRETMFNDQITVVLKDTAGLRYGLDYDLGDLVTLQWPGRLWAGPASVPYNRMATVDRQITGIKVQVFNHQVNAPGSNSPSGNEQIEITLDALDGTRHRQDARGNLQKIIDALRDDSEKVSYEATAADAYR